MSYFYVELPSYSCRNLVTFGIYLFEQPSVLRTCHILIGGLNVRDSVFIKDTDAFIKAVSPPAFP